MEKQSALTPAERMYERHKANVNAYQRRNPEKMREKHQARVARIKEDPVAHEIFKEKRREYEKKWRASKKQKIEEVTPVEVLSVTLPEPLIITPRPDPQSLGGVTTKLSRRELNLQLRKNQPK